MNRQHAGAAQGLSIAETPDARHVAHLLQEIAGRHKAIVVTIGVPLCSDGTKVSFGSGLYDPFDEKTLLALPDGLSEATRANLEYALEVCRSLRALRDKMQIPPVFSLSVFDTRVVHGVRKSVVQRIHAEIAQRPEKLLPTEALALHRELDGGLQFDFSLNYRRLGDRFIDRARSAIRPSVPSVPTPRLVDMFRSTGAVLLKQVDHTHPTSGMGRILCATPNTLRDGSGPSCLHRLDGKAAIQLGPSAIPLTNEYGSYICEVTAIGRILAMMSRGAASGPAVHGVVTLSILNVGDPGNHKIHRTSWSAGEMTSSLLPHVAEQERLKKFSQTHLTIVSDANHSVMTDSRPDAEKRATFLDRLHCRVHKAASPRKAEEIIAGELESIRIKVQDADRSKAPTLFLYGPGDYDVYRATGQQPQLLASSCGESCA